MLHNCKSMITYTLSDGKRVPALAWGAGSGSMFNGGQATEDMAVYALKAGIRHLDTAQVYQTEQQIGEAVRKGAIPREQVFVTSKRKSLAMTAPADSGQCRRARTRSSAPKGCTNRSKPRCSVSG